MASGLFLRSDLLGSGQKLLEIGTITNGIPNGVDPQTSYGSYLARRDGKQMSKPLNGFLRCARPRLDLRQPDLKSWTSHSIFFDRNGSCRLSGKAQSVGIAPKREVNPSEFHHYEGVLGSLSQFGAE